MIVTELLPASGSADGLMARTASTGSGAFPGQHWIDPDRSLQIFKVFQ